VLLWDRVRLGAPRVEGGKVRTFEVKREPLKHDEEE
jgi:hypothetical protein